jgi:hypothetical protein
MDKLPAALRDDLRGAIGWTLSQDDVFARGETVRDRWIVLSAVITIEDRLRTQAVWLRGEKSGRFALILQFAHGGGQFEAQYLPGTVLDADLAFWPSAWPQRAIVRERRGELAQLRSALPGEPTVASFLDLVATANAQLPWLARHPAILADVTIVSVRDSRWLLRDTTGQTIPLVEGGHWQILALTGGAPCTVVAEWDGEALLPLAIQHAGLFTRMQGGA